MKQSGPQVGNIVFNSLCQLCPWRDIIHELENRVKYLENEKKDKKETKRKKKV